ncbi:MAG: hypothetical protein Q9180_000697 [Flavoplaca navasiana]
MPSTNNGESSRNKGRSKAKGKRNVRDEDKCFAISNSTGEQCKNMIRSATKTFQKSTTPFTGDTVLKEMCTKHGNMYEKDPADVTFFKQPSCLESQMTPVALSPEPYSPVVDTEHSGSDRDTDAYRGPGRFSPFMDMDAPKETSPPRRPHRPTMDRRRAADNDLEEIDPPLATSSFQIPASSNDEPPTASIPQLPAHLRQCSPDAQAIIGVIRKQTVIIGRLFQETQTKVAGVEDLIKARHRQTTEALETIFNSITTVEERVNALGMYCGQPKETLPSRGIEVEVRNLVAKYRALNKREDEHYKSTLNTMAGHTARLETAVQNSSATQGDSGQKRRQLIAKINEQKTLLEADTAEWVDDFGEDINLA